MKRRVQLSFNTKVLLYPGAIAQITAHVRRDVYVERLRITDRPKDWHVSSLHIGDHLVWKGSKRPPTFARRGQAVALIVSYVGQRKKGRLFHGTLLGVAA